MTDKMDGFLMDIEATEQDKLRSLFPQGFTDGEHVILYHFGKLWSV